MREDVTIPELVDIRTVSIDKALPKEERVTAFLRQIKDPYRFRCGEFTITARYPANAPSFEECLAQIVT